MTLEGTPVTCPLWGIPEMQEAWHVKRGDLILLRSNVEMSPDALERARFLLQKVTEKTGVEFLILHPEMEVVGP
jgi:hypothetical protein